MVGAGLLLARGRVHTGHCSHGCPGSALPPTLQQGDTNRLLFVSVVPFPMTSGLDPHSHLVTALLRSPWSKSAHSHPVSVPLLHS